jgi:hypothetical protein
MPLQPHKTRTIKPVATIHIGPAWQEIEVFGHKLEVFGVPTVELAGTYLDGLRYMKPETAEALAQALLKAARLARGELNADR